MPDKAQNTTKSARAAKLSFEGSKPAMETRSGAAEPEGWGAIDFSSAHVGLPPPGEYQGRIAEVRLTDKGDTLWMAVTLRLDGHLAMPAAEMGAIAARDGSPHRPKVADGYRLLHRLAKAACVDLARINDPFDLPDAFAGRPLLIEVDHKTRDGVPELVVRRLKPLS